MNDKDIKILESYLEQQDRKFVSEYRLEFLQAIENLLKENEKLKIKIQFINKNNLDDLYEKALEKTMTKFLNDNIEKDFIPVAKIKEKIEELDTMIEKINRGELQKYTVSEIFTFQAIYEKLLEGK